MKNVKHQTRSNNGITLIALVITIVVLLILAAISFAAIAGDDGILERARQAKEKTEAAEEMEKTQLGLGGALIDKWAHGNTDSYNNMINEIMTADMMPKGLTKVEQKYNSSTNSWENILYLIVEYKGSYYATNFNNSSPSGIEEMLNNMVAASIVDLKEENEIFLTVWTVDNSCLYNGIVLENDDILRILVEYNEQNYEFIGNYDEDSERYTYTFTKSNITLEKPKLATISVGYDCAFGLDDSGQAWSLQSDIALNLNQISNLENIKFTKISAGNRGALLLDTSGKIWAYGTNYENQFGMVDPSESKLNLKNAVEKCSILQLSGISYDVYSQLTCVTDVSYHPLNGIKIIDIDLSKDYGSSYGMALDNTGKVYYWGYFIGLDALGQYDNVKNFNEDTSAYVQKTTWSPYEYVYEPICINTLTNSTLNGVTITKISAGYGHSLFLDSNGKVWSFGSRGEYENGFGIETEDYNNEYMPVCINDTENNPLNGVTITDISAGYKVSMFVDSEGNIWSCGKNYGHTMDNIELRPTSFTNPNYMVEKCADINLAKVEESYSSNIPICLSEITTNPLYGVKAKQISSGYYHSLILDTQGKTWAFGSLYCCGLDGYSYIPVCISNENSLEIFGKTIKHISAGYEGIGLINSNDGEYNLYEIPPR